MSANKQLLLIEERPAPGQFWDHEVCGRVRILRASSSQASFCELKSGARRVLSNALLRREGIPNAKEANQ